VAKSRIWEENIGLHITYSYNFRLKHFSIYSIFNVFTEISEQSTVIVYAPQFGLKLNLINRINSLYRLSNLVRICSSWTDYYKRTRRRPWRMYYALRHICKMLLENHLLKYLITAETHQCSRKGLKVVLVTHKLVCMKWREIWGSRGGEYENCGLLECDLVLFGRYMPRFRRNVGRQWRRRQWVHRKRWKKKTP
jgi:hypothetical protein